MTRLNEFADLLETKVPPGEFYMGRFCGTSCCVAGWAISFFGNEEDKRYMELSAKSGLTDADYREIHSYTPNFERRASELLGVPNSRMFPVYYGSEPGLTIHETDPKVAAAVLRNIAKELD